jgi:PPOX class probable F420-dependent enzyme
MEPAMMRRRVAQARVGRLATIRTDGRPHMVPVCFVLDGDRVISAVDHKPKTTTALQRLDNIRGNPRVSVLVDHYDEDWSQLWWVRIDGRARVLEEGGLYEDAIALLNDKYRGQYGLRPPDGPAIVISDLLWAGWSATP